MKVPVDRFLAWLRSLPGVLFWPLALWTMPCAFVLAVEPDWLSSLGFFTVLSIAIHFVAYLMLGLPIYLIFWESYPGLWRWEAGISLGLVLGVAAIFILLLMMDGVAPMSSAGLFSALVGLVYGVLSAAGAINSRRKLKK